MSSVVLRGIASTAHQDMSVRGADPVAHMDADMRHVLEVWRALGPRPIEQCGLDEARAQPRLAAALGRILRGREAADGVSMEMRMIPGPAGELKARVYAPAGEAAGRPLILYLHGGGFVLGDLGSFDATPRALARKLGAVVVSAHYRQAPEAPLPAAFADAEAAWRWTIDQAGSLGADPDRTALVGEDAGAALALDLSLGTAGREGPRPRHLGLVAPMGRPDFRLASYGENENSLPLGTAGIRWLHRKAQAGAGDAASRLDFAARDPAGLPPVTLIMAGLDPLRSEGEALAGLLRRAGVWVDATVYEGVSHGFFGLALVVNKAMFAQSQLLRNLGESLAGRGERPGGPVVA